MAFPVVDASSPVRFTGVLATGGTLSSSPFTAPANSVLVLCLESDGSGSNNTFTVDLTTGSALTWNLQVARDVTETTAGGGSRIYTAVATTSESRVVRVTKSSSGNVRVSCRIYVVTGADYSGTLVDTVGANNEGGASTNNLTTSSLTPGADGLLFAADCDWNALGAFQSSSDLTQDTDTYAGAISVCDGYKQCSSGVAVTANLNAAGTSAAQHKWCQIIVRAPGGGGGGPTLSRAYFLPLLGAA